MSQWLHSRKFPYEVDIRIDTGVPGVIGGMDVVNQLTDWLLNAGIIAGLQYNIADRDWKSKERSPPGVLEYRFVFRSPQHATMFKLAWGGRS